MRPTGETRLGFKERRDTILEIGRNTKRCGVIGFRQDLSRRDDRTQPGVLTPGGDQKKDPPQRGGRIGRLEERQASKWNFGRIVCRPFPPSSLIPELWRTSRAGPKTGTNPGLKPRAESLSPFGTKFP
jgi:hypothetical protein